MSHEGTTDGPGSVPRNTADGPSHDIRKDGEGVGVDQGTGSACSGEPSPVGYVPTNFTFDAINERLVRAGLKPFTREELRREAK